MLPETPAIDAGPSLSPGISRLHRPSVRSPALHQLVVGQLARTTGRVLWVDARNNASTYALHDRTRDPRLLDAIAIARAFTAYQHHTLVTRLVEEAGPETDLVVVPCTAALYRDDDLRGPEGLGLLDASLEILDQLAPTYDVPVLVTTAGEGGEYDRLVADRADRTITATETDQGLRFRGPDYETTAYWHDGSVQTTLPYWVDLFGCVCDDAPAVPTVHRPRGLVEG